MPKEMLVDPARTRTPGRLAMPDIPVHAYARPLAEERAARGDGTLVEALRHMVLIREFESMLASLKQTGAYRGQTYAYKGPAHLSMGQEAVAVGTAMALDPSDLIFGSHRSHGEFLAKGLAAIERLPADRLDAILAATQGGRLRDTVARAFGTGRLAEDVLLFGFLSEIFMKETGFNGGMGGSMHAFFAPFGAWPNNAIVGASAGIATGAALRRRLSGEGGIVVAGAGDGATGCGPVWEAMNFAAMGQLTRLWDEPMRGGLPVLFLFTNNFYAMGGQTSGETMAWDRLSRIGAGINADGMHAETVDGTDVLAVADAVARARARLVAGDGPALLDVECYRIAGHSTTDANAYRSREELALWEPHDPIARLAAALVAEGAMAESDVTALREEAGERIGAVFRAAIDPAIAPPVDIGADPTRIGRLMFADRDDPASSPATDIAAREDSAPLRALARKARSGLGPDGSTLSGLKAVTLRDALTEAILDAYLADPRLAAWGEEMRDWGGAFGVTRGLADVIPRHRLFNAPISEAAIVATAVGHAMAGGRSLVELMYGDFIGRAGDEILNQMAKWHAMSAGELTLPVVLRCSVGSKYGAQHSQDWSALIAHVPGLKIAYPATPYDAKGLMAEALAGSDPVVFFESQRLYDLVETHRPEGVPPEPYRIPFGLPDVKRPGTDATVLTFGPSLYPALAAAAELAESGVETEVIDARSLVPFDYGPVLDSVRRTGRFLLVTEASERGAFAQTVAATVTRHAFGALKAPPRVLGSPNWIVPGADMETTYFPQSHDIADLVMGLVAPDRPRNRRTFRDWDDLALARQGL